MEGIMTKITLKTLVVISLEMVLAAGQIMADTIFITAKNLTKGLYSTAYHCP